MKRKNLQLKCFLLPGIVLLSASSLLAACAEKPSYTYSSVNQALISKGLTLQMKRNAEKQFASLPSVVNSPAMQFSMVTIDPNFSPQFNFQEARTGYIFNQYFSQQKLIAQFVGNTLAALKSMGIKATKHPQRYRLNAQILKLSFTTKNLKNFEDLKKGYHDYMMGHLTTAYRIRDTYNHVTVWSRTYNTSATRIMDKPGQTTQQSAELMYQMMTDSSIKFGKDIAKDCSFYKLPNISCSTN